MDGLTDCADDDIVIISDLDEILRGSDVKKFVKPLIKQNAKVVSADLKFYSYYLNRQRKGDSLWRGPTAATYSFVKKKSPQKMRDQRGKPASSGELGWHFSSMGGLATYIDKVENFSHASEHDAQKKDPKNILALIQAELDLVPIDESYPRFVQEHQREYLEMGYIDFEGNPVYQ
jgi:beta-1,4-mannosyl-glycoprotein beta-1,4-N-acetylglucosaminyltransferase